MSSHEVSRNESQQKSCEHDVAEGMDLFETQSKLEGLRTKCQESLVLCGMFCRFDDPWTPSNETLLRIAFVSFLGFTTVQFSVAIIAKSEAMIGDSAAMLVDALTYGFNFVAERRKNEAKENEQQFAEGAIEITSNETKTKNGATRGFEHLPTKTEIKYDKRRQHLHLELVPPLMSVSILIVVIGFILRKAIHVLILDSHRSRKEQSRPNLVLMMTFSVLNLVLDIVNVTCFARAKHLMGYNTQDTHSLKAVQKYNKIDNNNDSTSGHIDELLHSSDGEDNNTKVGESTASEHIPKFPREFFNESKQNNLDTENQSVQNKHDSSHESVDIDENERVNLNMCSAYTHVFADTIRSVAVIIASVTAELLESVTPEEADATAAVIVSIIILVSLIPLFHGLFVTWSELRTINKEEAELAKNNQVDFDAELT